jgi:hypothetical protein
MKLPEQCHNYDEIKSSWVFHTIEIHPDIYNIGEHKENRENT